MCSFRRSTWNGRPFQGAPLSNVFFCIYTLSETWLPHAVVLGNPQQYNFWTENTANDDCFHRYEVFLSTNHIVWRQLFYVGYSTSRAREINIHTWLSIDVVQPSVKPLTRHGLRTTQSERREKCTSLPTPWIMHYLFFLEIRMCVGLLSQPKSCRYWYLLQNP